MRAARRGRCDAATKSARDDDAQASAGDARSSARGVAFQQCLHPSPSSRDGSFFDDSPLVEHRMDTWTYLTLDRDVRQLPVADIAAFSAHVSGGTLVPGNEGYDDARRIWNAAIDRRPALIARCVTEADVQAAVRFASEHRMLVSVRGGGHHI